MRALVLLTAMGLVGCGGSPFEVGPIETPAPDAAPESDASPSGDAAPESETATSFVDAGTDTSADAAKAGEEAAPEETCAPRAIDAGTCFGGLATSATFPVWSAPPDGGCAGSGGAKTPAACECDYSCACLVETGAAGAACAGNGAPSCREQEGVPVVTCD